MNMRLRATLSAGFAAVVIAAGLAPAVGAQAAGNFAMQLTPSPLVETVKPGVAKTVPLTIRNNGTAAEALKIEVRHFTYNSDNGSITIDDKVATDYSQWVTFASPKFTVNPAQNFTQNIKLSFPTNSGFSYSFVMIISRQSQPQSTNGGRLLQGSIADFGLVNIDRPGATKVLELTSLKASAGIYEYVPAQFTVKLKNNGNTIIQPQGNMYIGRGNADDPIATLPFNNTQSYILPNTSRTINTTWGDGFPKTVTTTAANGTTSTHNEWNLGDISKFRIGKYTARVVAVYNNGTYDVPLNATTTFWIIPWKILLVALLIFLIFAFGIFMIIRGAIKSRRPRNGGFRL